MQSPTATNLGDIRVDNLRVVKKLMMGCERVIMTAGVPCQSFSSAGNRSFNGELLEATIRVAVEAQVNVLLVECVPDLVRKVRWGPHTSTSICYVLTQAWTRS